MATLFLSLLLLLMTDKNICRSEVENPELKYLLKNERQIEYNMKLSIVSAAGSYTKYSNTRKHQTSISEASEEGKYI